jgi:argininosuccinate lyase
MHHRIAGLIAAACLACTGSTPAADRQHDDFAHLVEINKASLVMLVEERIVPRDLAIRIAAAIGQADGEQAQPGAARSANYLDLEARLIELAGPEASRIHTGRSRQDIGSTLRRMVLRESLLDSYEALLGARRSLLKLAADHVDTVIPAYTHGVQAQPTSLAHYLLAFSAAFERDTRRLEQVYARLNSSPLGAAALGTSGFALDRRRLAELLGFYSVVENSYDANLVASVDTKLDYANALATSAIIIGQLMQNLHTQYHDPHPWFLLPDENTDVSSIMPQKRNPRPIDTVRLLASGVVGGTQQVTLNAHNTMSGMNDYRPANQALQTAAMAREMYAAFSLVIDNLVVDADRALEEINADYSTTTEIADVLLRDADVPFRIGHHYASELTTYGRQEGKRPVDLTDEELTRIYREATGTGLPVSVDVIRAAMDPRAMVRARRGLGGPQPEEVLRMLEEHDASLETEVVWLAAAREQLVAATEELERRFSLLR